MKRTHRNIVILYVTDTKCIWNIHMTWGRQFLRFVTWTHWMNKESSHTITFTEWNLLTRPTWPWCTTAPVAGSQALITRVQPHKHQLWGGHVSCTTMRVNSHQHVSFAVEFAEFQLHLYQDESLSGAFFRVASAVSCHFFTLAVDLLCSSFKSCHFTCKGCCSSFLRNNDAGVHLVNLWSA